MRRFNLSEWAVHHQALVLFLIIMIGVAEGAEVVVAGVQKLDPGQKVRVVSSLSF